MRKQFFVFMIFIILLFTLSSCVNMPAPISGDSIDLIDFECTGELCDNITDAIGNATELLDTTLGNNGVNNTTQSDNATQTHTTNLIPTVSSDTGGSSGSASRSFRRENRYDTQTEEDVTKNLAAPEPVQSVTEKTSVSSPQTTPTSSALSPSTSAPVSQVTQDTVLDETKAYYHTGTFWIWVIVLLIALISGIIFFALHKRHS